ncbi:GspH/FimT family pseudopilin [Acinetobacter ursingii]|uniref:GspH/FimT family pseudopilin n=1 Tax=Acinetobacter ursingii TaxID=108980 RepID=UPI001250AD22|nr:GspH/FimT family pseudopilin [Acinetobacter ursingii]MCU4588892.1 GspH/FimT family pseudopilin [Acinetobacter ursingii]
MRRSLGFTLIELMVTIAVLAVIAMIAAPSFSSMIKNQRLKQSMTEVKNGIMDARSRAILTRSNTVFCPNTVSVADCGANITGYSSLNNVQKIDSVFIGKINTGITIKSNSANNFVFNPQGTLDSEKNITLCANNKSFGIQVYRFGGISINEGSSC